MSMSWTPLSDRMPNPDEHKRVLIFTQGVDFSGQQFFDVETDSLNECRYATPEDQPEVCKFATHWAPRLSPSPSENQWRLNIRDDSMLFIVIIGVWLIAFISTVLPDPYAMSDGISYLLASLVTLTVLGKVAWHRLSQWADTATQRGAKAIARTDATHSSEGLQQEARNRD